MTALLAATVVVGVGLVLFLLFRLLRNESLSAEIRVGPAKGGDDPPPSRRQDPVPPPELLEALKKEECVLFAGADLTFSDGPSRSQLLQALVERVGRRFPEDVRRSLGTQLKRGEIDLVADVLAPRVDPVDATTAIGALGARDYAYWEVQSKRFLRLLGNLPLTGVVTDMWTPFAEEVFEDRGPVILYPGRQPVESFARLLRSNNFFITHLWGSLAEPTDLRISWQQYRTALQEDRDYERFMASLISSRSFLFLGTSVAAIERFFESSPLADLRNRRHFAFVPVGSDEFALRGQSLRDRFGVELIPYWVRDEEVELLRFVEALHSGAGITRARMRGIGPSLPRLQTVRLENIGPFDSLELPLGAGTTVLLGDNGSGKSSILRAIALAFSGEGPAVDAAASGLLKSGAKGGRIEVDLAGETHVAELGRERGTVSVKAHLSPVAEGLWLGLGFPPLRGVAGPTTKGPRLEPPPDPSPADLLPLAANEVDTRLSDLQQWVVNLAVAARTDTEGGRKSGEILDAFFSIVAHLTPGVPFDYSGIDTDSWQVMVETEEGLLPLEQLSRGMVAVFSWIGVLLRRLFQIYGDGPMSPQANQALVLVDEVDLHLHPAWQRQVLPLVRRHFPNIQLIVSTHSPLVVGSVSDARLIHLERVGGRIKARAVTEGFDGWRSDQILTSTAFDLSTTRDEQTETRLREYRQLLSREQLTRKEVDRMQSLGQGLRDVLPYPQETKVGREAVDLVRRAMQDRLEEIPEARREAVREEAELYFQRLRGGEPRS